MCRPQTAGIEKRWCIRGRTKRKKVKKKHKRLGGGIAVRAVGKKPAARRQMGSCGGGKKGKEKKIRKKKKKKKPRPKEGTKGSMISGFGRNSEIKKGDWKGARATHGATQLAGRTQRKEKNEMGPKERKPLSIIKQ